MNEERLIPPKTKNRVVVLGGSGFLGRAIGSRLAQDRVETLSLSSAHIDLSKKSAVKILSGVLRPADIVVMLAAITPDKNYGRNALGKNVAMMEHLLQTLQKIEYSHFVYFSSDAVYGDQSPLINESTMAAPQDIYGAMHRIREIMAISLGANTLILRPTQVYGRGDPHNAYGPCRFILQALSENKITLAGHGEEHRDHIHVEDIAELTVRCLYHKISGILNLSSGRSPTFYEVAKLVQSILDEKIAIVEAPRKRRITHRHFDSSSLRRTFPGWTAVPLEIGMKTMIEKYRYRNRQQHGFEAAAVPPLF